MTRQSLGKSMHVIQLINHLKDMIQHLFMMKTPGKLDRERNFWPPRTQVLIPQSTLWLRESLRSVPLKL